MTFLETPEFQKIKDEFYPVEFAETVDRHRAYEERLLPYRHCVQQAIAACEQFIVAPLQKAKAERFAARLDRDGPLVKSPSSIDDKIFRYLSHKKVCGQEPTEALKQKLRNNRDTCGCFLDTFFKSLPDIMNDLARFRIIGNFLTDVMDLKAAFGSGILEKGNIAVAPNIDDRIEADRWVDGGSGHRAVHIRLNIQHDDSEIHVEVLLMSLLELGWDAKSHLFYELDRRGEGGNIGKKTRLRIRAMSDTVYVADSLFDEVLLKHEPDTRA